MNLLDNIDKSLIKEWHTEKNGDMMIEKALLEKSKRVWWRCKRGHEWDETVENRLDGRGCPYCTVYADFRTVKGVNDLETLKPDIARQWHPTKNGYIKPKDVTFQCNRKFWWKCDRGHEWRASVNTRSGGSNCPYCSNKKLLVGYNDFATLFPEHLDTWHPTKNGNLSPQDILGCAHTKVWWYMPYNDPKTGKHFDFEWESTVQSRVYSIQCPFLTNKRPWRGFNDLATVNPDVAKEWHPTKNGALTPQDVVAGSSKSVWWMCERGHEWKTSIYNRNKGAGCRKCYALSRRK